jgi:alpha-tubulin suppressor-like RCC1 family protein
MRNGVSVMRRTPLLSFRCFLLVTAALLLHACDNEPNEAPFNRPDAATPLQRSCDTDADCTDGVFCNGVETCSDEGSCERGAEPSCDDHVACTDDSCDEAGATCRHEAPDADRDGHADASCVNEDDEALGDDCDDADPGRFPGNTEICDAAGHDEDCDARSFGAQDADGDGHLNANCCNTADDGSLNCGDDCDDARAAAFPGNTENCDAIDNDCNGLMDHPIEDVDQDGYATTSCGGNDCDDHNPEIYAGAPEICDGRDSDCSADGGDEPGEQDLDTDGFVTGQCVATATLASGECDDVQHAVHPTASEVCNGRDDDCDRLVDEGAGDCGRGVRSLAARYLNSMAVHVDGTVSAWGHNMFGFTNTAATIAIEVPQQVLDGREPDGLLHHVGSVGLGESAACAVHLDGRVSCWGYGRWGALGNGQLDDAVYPPADIGLGDVVEVVMGANFGCARDVQGSAYCWGSNSRGEVGDGTTIDRAVPVRVETLEDVVDLAAGTSFVCAALGSGRVYCWGSNSDGQLGDTTLNDRSLPTRVFGIDDAAQVAAGTHTTCVVHRDRTVSCWGSNEGGQQGGAEYVDALVPAKVLDASGNPLGGVVDLAVTGDRPIRTARYYGTSCARLADGRVFCWGTNEYGQLGIGVTPELYSVSVPYIVITHFAQYAVLSERPTTWDELESLPPFRATQITGGQSHLCATDEAGLAYCWGDSGNFQTGNGGGNRPHLVENLP